MFPRAEIKLFQTDVDESLNNFACNLCITWPNSYYAMYLVMSCVI